MVEKNKTVEAIATILDNGSYYLLEVVIILTFEFEWYWLMILQYLKLLFKSLFFILKENQ